MAGKALERQQVIVRPGKPIRLGQFLKLAGMVETGGEAKLRIAEGEVLVNGEEERRRGRQLAHGDLVAFGEAVLEVIVAADGSSQL